jgi:class 3 adenylate cyclase
MPEERKLVSVLFADLVGSTAIGAENDPEIVRAVLGRYFEGMRRIAETHGGTVEKFIGDAVMAVFGVPVAHDDDAERAVRAALAMRDAMAGLNNEPGIELELRVGVNTGEAVAETGDVRQSLVTGDVVNVAARIQQAADPGQVLVGQLTERLTRPAIVYDAHEPVVAKGKPEPVSVNLAVRARTAVPEQARGLPSMRARLVGRERELRLLVDTFGRATEDQRAQLFTLVGNAGVGKSRLVAEFLARVGSSGDVLVRRGRCLPYGTGITWWPFVEMVQADAGIGFDEARAVAATRLQHRLGDLFANERERHAVGARLTVMLGLADAGTLEDVPGERLASEVGWALRRYAEAIAGQAPAVFVVDDLQWAEAPTVEALRGIVDRAPAAPILVVCIARPDLLERHPAWGAGQPNATLIVLEPLTDEETRTLIARLLDIDDLPEGVRSEIIRRSEGNPLFCEELLRMLIDDGQLVRDGDRWRAVDVSTVRIPESIQALLAARLDALAVDEKRAVQAASVIGERLTADQLAGLVSAIDSSAVLDRLDRRGLIVEDRAHGPGAYRFRHLLIRDVAYGMVPKQERAALHAAFGRALAADLGERRDELTEILAHHAERALRLSLEVRLSGPELSVRAREALGLALPAADRAVRRRDLASLTVFLTTVRSAVEALGPDRVAAAERAQVGVLEAERRWLEADYATARSRIADAIELARDAGRVDLEARAQLALARVLAFSSSDEELEAQADSATRAAALFRERGDTAGRIAAESIALELDFGSGRLGAMLETGQRLVEEARVAGARAEEAALLARLASAASWYGKPDLADELETKGLALAEELSMRATSLLIRFFRARAAWMRGELAAAEAALIVLRNEADEAADGQMRMATRRLLAETMLEAGRASEAEAQITAALELSVQLGERWNRTELLAYRAWCAIERGDLHAAESDLVKARETLRNSDVAAASVLAETTGRLRAAQRRDREADAEFATAVGVIRSTDFWWWVLPAVTQAEYLVDRQRFGEARDLVDSVVKAHANHGFGLRWPQVEALRERLAAAPA